MNYISVVDELAENYFDTDGNYVPHMGLIHAMKVFYNECVLESDYDDRFVEGANEAEIAVELFSDETFVEAFNSALIGDSNLRFDFANAYKAALDIVADKKSSLTRVVNGISGIFENISSALTPENIENVAKVADSMGKGDIGTEAVVKYMMEQGLLGKENK